MAKYLNPKVDLTFKKVFGEHPNLVKSLLNALLPLPEGMTIETVDIISPETVPENPGKKYSVVDVRCTDNNKRGFIVEMQSYWNREFFSRTLFNATSMYATSMYARQLERGNSFVTLQEVYSLALVNDRAFDYDGDEDYMQEFYITNRKHPEDVRRDLSLIFVELVKYKPKDRGSRAIKDLWLRYLTEINEETKHVDEVMLASPEISQALQIVERSAYSDAEMYEYEDYLLEVMTQRNAAKAEREVGFSEGRAEGLAEGKAEGRAEGRAEALQEVARKMKSLGMQAEDIAKATGLPEEVVAKL